MTAPGPLQPGDSRAIAFDGEIVSLLPLGLRRVRLDNGHMVTVLPSFGRATDVPLVGDRVVVEIAFNQLKGWRLARRP